MLPRNSRSLRRQQAQALEVASERAQLAAWAPAPSVARQAACLAAREQVRLPAAASPAGWVAVAVVTAAVVVPRPRRWRLPTQAGLTMQHGPFSCSSMPHSRLQPRERGGLNSFFPHLSHVVAFLSLILGTCRHPGRIFVIQVRDAILSVAGRMRMTAGRFRNDRRLTSHGAKLVRARQRGLHRQSPPSRGEQFR